MQSAYEAMMQNFADNDAARDLAAVVQNAA